ncbi:MAG: hypothetical protein OXT71_07320 [Acidobacteriota bacterium]|nr:hypothetical protein [Acidobacteriota bacterium]
MPDQFTTVTLPISGGFLLLAGLILTQSRAIRSELREAAQERTELRNQIGELRERMAHLQGLLEGLREAITRRNVA